MTFSKTLTCAIVASYFKVLKKKAIRLMLGKKSEAEKCINKSMYIFYSPVFEERNR